MPISPRPIADDASDADDHDNKTARSLTPGESSLTINVDPADTDENPGDEDFAEIVQAQMARLHLSRGSNSGLETPSTANDLYDATPRASPSPELRPHDEHQGAEPSPADSNENQLANDMTATMSHLQLGNGSRQYSVRDEAFPLEPFFDRDFQECLKSGKAIAGDIHTNLSACALAAPSDSELGRLRASANRLKSFESPAARLGDHGSAVTCFVTEYHRRSALHTRPFTIEVEYCSEAEINEQLHELLFSYRELYEPGLARFFELNEQQHFEVGKKSELALSTLQSIFAGHPEVTPSYLKEQSEGAFERILGELRRLAALIEWPPGAANGSWMATAASSDECHDKVAYFMQQGLWPLTNIVRIYLSAQVLKTGVVLADLPGRLFDLYIEGYSLTEQGYRDINLARVRKAEQYLLHCHEVFIVANIHRVVSDRSVERFVRDQMKAPGERKCVTIDIDLPKAAKEYNGVALSSAGRNALQAQADAWGPNGSAIMVQVANTQYKYLFVSARNADVKRALKHRYANSGIGLSINVFCVGNRDYEGAKYRCQEARTQAIQGSCIPDLRRFCHSIVAQAQYRASLHFLEIEIPSLIQSLEVWLSASEQRTLVTVDAQAFKELQSNLVRTVDDFVDGLDNALSVHILDHLSENDEAFNDDALKKSEEWTTERELAYLLKNVCFEVKQEVQNIGFNAMGGHVSSFISDLMIPTYRACAADKGSGTQVRMHQIMRRRLGRRDVFDSIHNRIQAETDVLYNEKADSIRNHVIEMTESMARELKTFSGPELEAQKANPQGVEQVRRLTNTARDKITALQHALETFKTAASIN
ncbi:MAG: hypothetical protein Q9166_008029 [cf. Caloplaca sp. 2 TL-2023]